MLDQVRWINFKTVSDQRGDLSIVEGGIDIPFEISRIYYLYNFKGDRGSHAHRRLMQIFIAMSGRVELLLDDGVEKKKFILDGPQKGLYLPPGLWRDIKNLSSDAMCLVLASEHYNENEYIRDYGQFLKEVRGGK